jgi:hypothetical protein
VKKLLIAICALVLLAIPAGANSSTTSAGPYPCGIRSYLTEWSSSFVSATSWNGSVTANYTGYGATTADGFVQFDIQRGSANINVLVQNRDGTGTKWFAYWNAVSGSPASGQVSGVGNSATFSMTYNATTFKYTFVVNGVTRATNLSLGGGNGAALYAETYHETLSEKNQPCPSMNGTVTIDHSMASWVNTYHDTPYYEGFLSNGSMTANYYTGSQP